MLRAHSRCSCLFVFPSIFFVHTSATPQYTSGSLIAHLIAALHWGLQAYYHAHLRLTLKLTSSVPLCSLYALLHTSRHNYHLSLLGVPCAVSAMRLGRYDFGAWSGFHASHRATYGVSALRVSIPNAVVCEHRNTFLAKSSARTVRISRFTEMESPCWLMW